MTSDLFSGEVQGAIDRLQAGGRLYVIEEKPYPAPHRVVIVLKDEQYSLTYNDFVQLITQHLINLFGTAEIEGFSAEVYVYSPPSRGKL